MANNRAYVDDNGRILRNNQPEHPPIVEWEDDLDEDEPQFSTYFAENKVEIPSFPDDDKVIIMNYVDTADLVKTSSLVQLLISFSFVITQSVSDVFSSFVFNAL
jgi:hypothetical protein